MRELIITFDNLLREQNLPATTRWNKGLTAEQIQEKLASYPFELTSELTMLYQWHNGSRIDESRISNNWLFPGGWFLPIEEALRSYKEIKELETDASLLYGWTNRWRDGYFPVFSDANTDYYIVECAKQEGISEGSILSYGLGSPDDVFPVYDNVEKLLITVITCYQERAYYYDSDSKSFVINEEHEATIRRRINLLYR